MQIDKELERLIDEVFQSKVVDISSVVASVLQSIRSKCEAKAMSLGKGRTKDEYENLKEWTNFHYNALGQGLLSIQLSSLAVLCYSHLNYTLEMCSRLTDYPFDRGLALFNAGLAYLQIGGVFEEGLGYVELAQIEDADIRHHAGMAASTLDKIKELAWQFCDELSTKSGLMLKSASKLVTRLNESEQFRLLLIVLRYQSKGSDHRGYLAKDMLEKNLNSVGKLTEAYLKRATSKDLMLKNLIEQAFQSTYCWRRIWQTWTDTVKPSYASAADEKKISDILADKTSPYEAKMFEMLCLMRNFTAHLFNDRSIVFQTTDYETVFSMCLCAFLYSLDKVF